uniref:receptor protein-tyrosine kinase n=1 Tax=Pinctada fucata TaxID=50426 RepID=A0A0F6TNS6_PINFU|nr:epidermal growth factor receptor [Pinctada fucata]
MYLGVLRMFCGDKQRGMSDVKFVSLVILVLLGFGFGQDLVEDDVVDDIDDVSEAEIDETISKSIPRGDCYGTHVGFGYSGGPDYHYEMLIKRYKGCTHVEGNLEIASLSSSANISYDLSFLSTIEVVTGYVLLGLLDVDVIPLTSLKLIRADNTYKILGEEYGLVVALTTEHDGSRRTGLRELQLPALREIARGKVLFQQNPLLCFVDTIAWNVIVPREEYPVIFGENAYDKACDLQCASECEVDGKPYCWGQGIDMCQTVHTPVCDPFCPGRCFNEDIFGCCHPECAVGCTGPSDTDCVMCKYFEHDGRCVPSCPADVSYREGQVCRRHLDNYLPND